MTKTKGYGLAACIWRRLRAVHGGGDLLLYGRDGLVIGKGFLFRYDAHVALPVDMDFKAVSWKTRLDHAPGQGFDPASHLGPTPIAIGQQRWG